MQSLARRALEIGRRLASNQQGYGIYSSRRSLLEVRGLHSTVPRENFITKARESSQEKAEQQVFDAQMKFFLDRSNGTFDGNVYLRFLEMIKKASGLTGVKGAFNQNNPAMHEMNEKMTIINTMTPAERANPEQVQKGQAVKRRLSNATGYEMEKVDEALDGLSMYGAIQDWVRKRDDAGLVLPKNSAELQGMIRVPGSGLNQKRPRRRSIRSCPGLGSTIRRKYRKSL